MSLNTTRASECPKYPGTGPCRCRLPMQFGQQTVDREALGGMQPLIADRLMRGEGAERDKPRYFPSVDTPGVLPLRWARPC